MEDHQSISPEELLRLFSLRQSDRAFTDQEVPRDKIERILEAGRLAPSANNAQPWHFIVVSDPEPLEAVAQAIRGKTIGVNRFANQSKAMIVIARESTNLGAKLGSRVTKTDYPLMDIGIAASQMCLQAAAEGLGSCMIGWMDKGKIREALAIPEKNDVPLVILLGYSTQKLRKKSRKPMEKIVSWNRY